MLEVVFSDSAKASMKMAKCYNKKRILSGPMVFYGEKPFQEELEKLYEGEPLGGDSRDVVGIGFNLDIGGISGAIDGKERQGTFAQLLGLVDSEKEEMKQFFSAQREDLEKLIGAAKNGTPIRIWRSNTPYSVCGYAFVCHILKNIECEMSVVTLPEVWKTAEDEVTMYADWGEVCPGKLYQFVDLEREITIGEKLHQSDLWNTLKVENAPLRAVINGQLISVAEDFYDPIIIRNIPKEEITMGRFVGTLLGKHPLGVGDGWYALRIQKMIDEKLLEVVGNKNADRPYGRVLRKGKQI